MRHTSRTYTGENGSLGSLLSKAPDGYETIDAFREPRKKVVKPSTAEPLKP
jgi:hypothetical protein